MKLDDAIEALSSIKQTHTTEIDHETISPPDLIEPELIDEDQLIMDQIDEDGMQIGLIESDGMLIRIHRPSDELAADDNDREARWVVDRAGDFSSVLD
jgi:hypothetical protein